MSPFPVLQTLPLNGFGTGVTLTSGQHAINQNVGVDNNKLLRRIHKRGEAVC